MFNFGPWRSPNPRYNLTLAEAKAVVSRMRRLGLPIGVLGAVPTTGAPGTVPVLAETEIVRMGGRDESLNYHLIKPEDIEDQANIDDARNVGLVDLTLGNGGIGGYLRMYADFHPGATNEQALAALASVPEVAEAIEAVLRS